MTCEQIEKERDALRAELDAHIKLNEPSKVTKYMAEAICLEKERDKLRAALEEIQTSIRLSRDDIQDIVEKALGKQG
jgi:hypothetical protein